VQDFRHVCPIEVRFKDLDVLGHVNNAVVLTYAETARVRYAIDLGLHSLQDSWRNLSFILAHISCNFKRPIFYGQAVMVGTRLVEIKRSSLKLAYCIEADSELVAEGDAILVYYDYVAKQSMPIPVEMRAKVEAFEQG